MNRGSTTLIAWALAVSLPLGCGSSPDQSPGGGNAGGQMSTPAPVGGDTSTTKPGGETSTTKPGGETSVGPGEMKPVEMKPVEMKPGESKAGAEMPADSKTQASKTITAATGGTLALEGGVKLEVPAGALPADTTLTVKATAPGDALPERASLSGMLYDFGPNGTKFAKPVTLTLPAPASVPDGKMAVVSWLDTKANAWVDLQSQTAGGSITAPVDHFTTFVVRFAVGTAVPSLPGSCGTFTKCGGDVVGTWVIDNICVTTPASDPFNGKCPTAKFDLKTDVSGEVTFVADGTYKTHITTGGKIVMTMPPECMKALMVPECSFFSAAFQKDNPGAGCTGTAATTGCECTVPVAPQVEMAAGTWKASGSTLTTTKAGGTPESSEYCVKGNALSSYQEKMKDKGTETAMFTAHRK